MTKSLFILTATAAFAVFSLSNLSTAADRISGRTHEPNYTYEKDYDCDPRVQLQEAQDLDSGIQFDYWSSLANFSVGPNTNQLHKRFDEHILRPFTSDGCSVGPDMPLFGSPSEGWAQCCVAHDTAYWVGGTKAEKQKADRELEHCINGKGLPGMGATYAWFVALFGGPGSQETYRWGYGWNYNRPYGPITDTEAKEVRSLYGADPEPTKNTLLDSTTKLLTVCNYRDRALRYRTADDQSIYSYLNQNLKQESVIISALNLISPWTKGHVTYQVKLRGCTEPIKISLDRYSNAVISVSSNCDLLDSKK